MTPPTIPDVMLTLLQTIHDDLQDIKGKQEDMQQTLTDHINTEPNEWAEILNDLVKRSFPNEDPEGHRRYHEAEMNYMEARAEFWRKLLFEVSKYGLIGVVGWLAYTVWVAFLHGPGK